MQCQECGQNEAVVHLTQIVDNDVTTRHLCEACAAEKGIESGAGLPQGTVGDFLSTMGKGVGGDTQREKATYPSVHGLPKAREMALEAVDGALEAIKIFDDRADPLRHIAKYIIERKK